MRSLSRLAARAAKCCGETENQNPAAPLFEERYKTINAIRGSSYVFV